MILLLTSLAMQAVSPGDMNKRVEVDGRTYRVEVRGNVVSVSRKAFAYKPTLDERDRQRAAVMKATGCALTDEFQPQGNVRLRGRLNCDAQRVDGR